MAQHSENPDPEGALRHEALAHPTKAHVVEPGQHVDGTMDVTRQEQTFVGFMRFAVRVTIVIIVLLVFLALVNA